MRLPQPLTGGRFWSGTWWWPVASRSDCGEANGATMTTARAGRAANVNATHTQRARREDPHAADARDPAHGVESDPRRGLFGHVTACGCGLGIEVTLGGRASRDAHLGGFATEDGGHHRRGIGVRRSHRFDNADEDRHAGPRFFLRSCALKVAQRGVEQSAQRRRHVRGQRRARQIVGGR
jgi:hypothetical protein